MEMKIDEKTIEKKLINAVKSMGGIAPKFVSPGFDGMPDRLVLLPGGVMAFAELKAPGKKPTPAPAGKTPTRFGSWDSRFTSLTISHRLEGCLMNFKRHMIIRTMPSATSKSIPWPLSF
jgi:hypothetical protein